MFYFIKYVLMKSECTVSINFFKYISFTVDIERLRAKGRYLKHGKGKLSETFLLVVKNRSECAYHTWM